MSRQVHPPHRRLLSQHMGASSPGLLPVRTSRAAGLLLIGVLLALLPVAAAARPPDPTWINGIYDEADGDDIVALVADTAAPNDGTACELLSPVRSSETLTRLQPTWYRMSRSRPHERGPPRIVARAMKDSSLLDRTSVPLSVITVCPPACNALHAFHIRSIARPMA